MSPLTLKLHFTGLCSFKPWLDISQPNNGATVVLPNSRNSPCEKHYAAVLCSSSFVFGDPSNRPPNRQFLSKGYREYGLSGPIDVFFIESERLQIHDVSFVNGKPQIKDPGYLSQLRFMSGSAGAGYGCPKQSNSEDFAWVAPMKQGGAPEMDSAHSGATPDLDVVSVQVELNRGTLTTGGFLTVVPPEQSERYIVLWEFNESYSALAEQAVCTIEEIAAQAIALVSSPIAPSPSKQNLILKPPTGADTITAWVVNLPYADILEANPPSPLHDDLHFHEYYRLARSTSPGWPIPRNPVPCCTAFQNVSNPQCPPSRFEP